jgi:hypothetical protein
MWTRQRRKEEIVRAGDQERRARRRLRAKMVGCHTPVSIDPARDALFLQFERKTSVLDRPEA